MSSYSVTDGDVCEAYNNKKHSLNLNWSPQPLCSESIVFLFYQWENCSSEMWRRHEQVSIAVGGVREWALEY